MNTRRFVVPLALVLVMLSSATLSEATPRARTLAESVLNDPPVRVTAGGLHTCQVKEDGTVRCWGANFSGQLGNGTTNTSLAPVPVSGVTAAVAVAAGSFFTCALIVDSTVRCWGDNGAGQLGDGTTIPRSTAAPVTGLSNVVVLAAGSQHVCALLADGNVRCWGANGSGQLGDGGTTPQTTPVAVGIPYVVGLAAGASHTCAVLADGTARCWGSNSSGQLGDATTVTRLMPVSVSGLVNAVAITARNVHTCTLMANGTVRCWGSNTSGQLGDASTVTRLTPVPVSGLTNAVGVTAGNLHTCAVVAGGIVGCWGSSSAGQLGDGTAIRRLTPVAVIGLTNAVALAAGTEHSCAVVADGSARCWGSNLFAQLGNGTTTNSLTPSAVAGGGGSIMVRGIAAGIQHTCVVRASGTVSCWGNNFAGQLGDNSEINRLTPVTVSGLTSAIAITAGAGHTCALLANGTVRCWGYNGYGQLGDNSRVDRLTPVTVSGLTSVIAIAAGEYHTCALLANGTGRCWGLNLAGQVGDGSTLTRLTPVAVVGLANAVAITAAGQGHSCALLANGSGRCWGGNSNGELGDDSTALKRLTPVPVKTLAHAAAIMAGYDHTCAIEVDRGVRCWGGNFVGQLGDGTTINRPTPLTLSGLVNAVALAPGNGHTCALFSGGGAQCWGWNDAGQLGDGTTTARLFPTTVMFSSNLLVVPLKGAARIAAAYQHTCTVQATGSVLCWGDNSVGQLGDGTTTDKLRPGTAPLTLTRGVPSITLNIDPRVTLDDDLRQASVVVLAACDEGQELHLDVLLTQGAVSGRASAVEACAGGLARYPVTVLASLGAAFRAGPAEVHADGVISENGAVVEAQQWTRAVNVVGTDGSLEGSASGIASGTDNASVRLSGQFTAEESVSLDQATLTVTALLLESGGAGELVRGAGGAALLPLALTPRTGSTPTAAIYQTASGVRPTMRVEVKSRHPEIGLLEYSVVVDRATISGGPTLCSGSSPTTTLRTRFSLHGGGDAPVDLDLTVPWRCQGTQLRTP